MKLNRNKKLLAAHTPDPDDAYAWWALSTGRLRIREYSMEVETPHIQIINSRCLDGVYDIAAISSAVYPRIADQYAILSPGASVGRGYGPGLASVRLKSPEELKARHRVAIPGALTTGAMLFRLFYPGVRTIEMPCDQIAEAILTNRVDAGVLIHEELLNWKPLGLARIECLGGRWTDETGLPIPVGLNVVHRRLGGALMRETAEKIRLSMEWAPRHHAEARAWAMGFTIEREAGIGDRFIDMFANDDTLALKQDCRIALRQLYAEAYEHGLIRGIPQLDIIETAAEIAAPSNRALCEAAAI